MMRLGFGSRVYWRGDAAAPTNRRVELYIEPRDVWVGVFVGPDAVYVCPLPCVVIRVARGPAAAEVPYIDPWDASTDNFKPVGITLPPVEHERAPDEMTGEFAPYHPRHARTFTVPRQALNDAENIMLALLRRPGLLDDLGWWAQDRRVDAARRAISGAIEASDREPKTRRAGGGR